MFLFCPTAGELGQGWGGRFGRQPHSFEMQAAQRLKSKRRSLIDIWPHSASSVKGFRPASACYSNYGPRAAEGAAGEKGGFMRWKSRCISGDRTLAHGLAAVLESSKQTAKLPVCPGVTHAGHLLSMGGSHTPKGQERQTILGHSTGQDLS